VFVCFVCLVVLFLCFFVCLFVCVFNCVIFRFGRIGQAIAKRAHFGFDCNIRYHQRNRANETTEQSFGNATFDSNLENLLENCDFVVLSLPYSLQGSLAGNDFNPCLRYLSAKQNISSSFDWPGANQKNESIESERKIVFFLTKKFVFF
jgi:hypothetical protein